MNKGSWSYPLAVTSLYLVLGSLSMLRHEMWRDEIVMWLIAQDSSSLQELWAATRYGGHPLLWFLLLYGLKYVWTSPVAMQVLHLLVAGIAACVFLKSSPFGKPANFLFLFGYFPFYEYCVKSRSYVLGLLFLWIACALFRARGRHPIALAVSLFLLCQTSVLGILLAFALATIILVDAYAAPRRSGDLSKDAAFAAFLTAGSVLAGAAIAIPQMMPAPDSVHAAGWFFQWDARWFWEIFSTLRIAYLTGLRDMTLKTLGPLDGWISVALAATAVLLFVRRPLALALYGLGNLALLGFFYIKYEGFIWHHGYLYLLLVACLWISYHAPAVELRPAWANRLALFFEKAKGILMVVLFGAQAVTGIRAHLFDWREAYSAGKATAEYMKAQGLDQLPMVGDEDIHVVTVTGYLGRPMYYPRAGRTGTYYTLNKGREVPFTPRDLIDKAEAFQRARGEDVMLVLSYELPPEVMKPSIVKVAGFTESLWKSERYYLYRMRQSV